MAAPNIVGVTTITGVTTTHNHSNTEIITLVNNPRGSERSYKINNISVSNIDTTNAGLVTYKHHQATGSIFGVPGAGTSISICNQLGIATGTTIVVTDRASAFYLQEGECISGQANVANLLNTIISYEIIE